MIVHKKTELKKIWCPDVRLLALDSGFIMTNRGDVFDPSVSPPRDFCGCIGNGCANWDWHIQEKDGFCSKRAITEKELVIGTGEKWKPKTA